MPPTMTIMNKTPSTTTPRLNCYQIDYTTARVLSNNSSSGDLNNAIGEKTLMSEYHNDTGCICEKRTRQHCLSLQYLWLWRGRIGCPPAQLTVAPTAEASLRSPSLPTLMTHSLKPGFYRIIANPTPMLLTNTPISLPLIKKQQKQNPAKISLPPSPPHDEFPPKIVMTTPGNLQPIHPHTYPFLHKRSSLTPLPQQRDLKPQNTIPPLNERDHRRGIQTMEICGMVMALSQV